MGTIVRIPRVPRRIVTTILIAGLLGSIWVFLHSHSVLLSFSPPKDIVNKALKYDFTWTIFITPQGFEGLPDKTQRRAIQSWLRLKPKPNVVLVGQGKGYDIIAQDFGVDLYPNLDMNFSKST